MKAIVVVFFMMIGLGINAQTSAQSYFNSGAKEFIHSELKKAMAAVDQGLQKYPQDENLNELKEKLIEEKKKEDQKKDQDKKDQDKKDDQNKKDQDKKKDKNKDEEKKKDDEKKENEKKDEENKKNEEDKKKEQQPQPQVGQMSPQQIKQLLETMNNEEAKTQKKVNAQKVKGKKVQQEKDW
jgi:hypothetical protein